MSLLTTKHAPASTSSKRTRTHRWWIGTLALVIAIGLWLTRPPGNLKMEPIPAVSTGFHRSCTVVRDKFQIPHITAQTQEAALYCWGRIHAQDRGWQMDHLRRIAYGRVAEAHGAAFVKQDFFLRIIDLAHIAKRWASHLRQHQPDRYRRFQFYIWGINDGLRLFNKKTPRHYVLATTGQIVAPWNLEHSLSLLLLQGLQMTSISFSKDIKHARYRLALGEKRYHELYGPDRGNNPLDHPILQHGEHPLLPHHPPIPPSQPNPNIQPQPTIRPTSPPHRPHQPTKQGSLDPLSSQKLAALTAWFHGLPAFFAKTSGGLGSNSWVVAPSQSASEYPLLANDTHMPITTPNFWHEVHLRTKDMDSSGFAIPGLPGILIGHNRYLAWGLTAGQNNSADVVEATNNPDGSLQMGKERLSVETFRPIVSIKVGPFYVPVFWKTFRRTRLGPILPVSWPRDKVLLLRWTPFHIEQPPLALTELMKQRDIYQADQVLQQMTFPNLNAVTADTHGNIGYRQFGLIPKRISGIHGLLDPHQPGAAWDGFLSVQENPHWLRDARRCKTTPTKTPMSAYEQAVCRRQFLVTANNRPFPHTYPFFLGNGFDKGLRAKRIEHLLHAKKLHTLEDMKQIQLDVFVPAAEMLLPRMLQSIKTESKHLSPIQQKVVALLQRWNQKAAQHQIEPTLFRTWIEFARQRMFALDAVEIENEGKQYPGRLALWRGMFGQIPLGSTLPLGHLLRQALQDTLSHLTQLYGNNMKTWTWGRINQVPFHSLVGPATPWTPGPQGKAGDLDSVNVAHHDRKPGPYQVQYAASVRLVIELGPRIRSYGVLAGQQIDTQPHQLSEEHQRWLRQEYRIRPYHPKEIQDFFLSQEQISF